MIGDIPIHEVRLAGKKIEPESKTGWLIVDYCKES